MLIRAALLSCVLPLTAGRASPGATSGAVRDGPVGGSGHQEWPAGREGARPHPKSDGDQLRIVLRRVEGMITNYRDRKRREAISAAEQVAKDHGFKLAELVSDRQAGRGAKSGASKSSAPAKYVNPDDPQQT